MASCSFSLHSFQRRWTQPQTSVACTTDKAQCPQQPPLPGRQASPIFNDTTVPHIYIHISWTSITSLFVTEKKPEPMKSLWWKLTSDKRNLLPSARMSHLSFFPSVQRFQVHDQSNSCSIEAILFCCMVCIHKETEALATVIKLRYFNKRAPDVWTEDQWLQNLFRNLFILPYS